MYPTLLTIHSLLRWIVLVAALVAIARAVAGWSGNKVWTPADDRIGKQFSAVMGIQFLVGLVLYGFLSPITAAAFQDFGAAMRDSIFRFWAVEHITGMVVAMALAGIGRARGRRQTSGPARHRTTAIFFGLSLLVMLASIPWPFTAAARPYFRF
jgi:hypothetical protein